MDLRSRWLNRPYGDQGLFVLQARFRASGGFPEVPILEDLLWVRQMHRTGRIVILPEPLLPSGRRWQHHGVLKTTLLNCLILLAARMGFSLEWLRGIYQGKQGQ